MPRFDIAGRRGPFDSNSYNDYAALPASRLRMSLKRRRAAL